MVRAARGYRVAAPGTLSCVGSVVPLNSAPIRFWIPPDGNNVYCGHVTATGMSQFARDPVAGTLTTMGTASGPYSVDYITGTSDGKFVYNSQGGGSKVGSYSRNLSTGVLTAIGTGYQTQAGKPGGIGISADDAFVYCASKTAPVSVYMYSRNATSGALTALSPANIACGTQPYGLIVVGNNVYVGDFSSGSISLFSRDPGTGLLTAMSPATMASGNGAAHLCASPDGKNVYVVNDGDKTVSQFARDTTTGALTAMTPATVTCATGPWWIQVTSDGKYAYVADSDYQRISQFSRDATTGALTAMAQRDVHSDPTSMVVPTNSLGAQGLVISPDNKHLYAAGSIGAGVIAQFNIHP